MTPPVLPKMTPAPVLSPCAREWGGRARKVMCWGARLQLPSPTAFNVPCASIKSNHSCSKAMTSGCCTQNTPLTSGLSNADSASEASGMRRSLRQAGGNTHARCCRPAAPAPSRGGKQTAQRCCFCLQLQTSCSGLRGSAPPQQVAELAGGDDIVCTGAGRQSKVVSRTHLQQYSCKVWAPAPAPRPPTNVLALPLATHLSALRLVLLGGAGHDGDLREGHWAAATEGIRMLWAARRTAWKPQGQVMHQPLAWHSSSHRRFASVSESTAVQLLPRPPGTLHSPSAPPGRCPPASC